MTKLEEKLLELGFYRLSKFFYRKHFKFQILEIELNWGYETIANVTIIHNEEEIQNEEIEEFRIQFNQLQKDLEVLKEYEKLD